ncbi:hypothetical protein BX667DRAFT_503320 [Coemansia mojavensis]|nr:hypothetical protein BX667DRAFT_503320 [Coemansia mojavensis]
MSTGGNIQYVYRWRIGQWSALAPCVEHNSPAFDADGLRWVFKLFKGRTRSPNELALYLAVHDAEERLTQVRKKVDIAFTLENQSTRGLDYSKYATPITVWVDAVYSTWGDDRFIGLADMEGFVADDTACLVVRFRVRETVQVRAPTAQPSPAIAVYVPDRIAAPFNQLLKSARFSDIQLELCDSAALLLSPGPNRTSRAGLGINATGHPTPDPDTPQCITPMPTNCCPRALPYAQRNRIGSSPPPPAGPRYHAHKAILMAVSPVFEAMFSNGMRETHEKVVQVWDVTPRAFERMLEYAYTRSCDIPRDVSADELVETLLCADQFAVSGLLDACWRSLLQRVNVDTVWDIWAIADDLNAREAQRTCLSYCTRNFSQLCESSSTMWAPAHLLRQALISDSLNVQSEELLFETVVRWAEFREDDMEERRSKRASRASVSEVDACGQTSDAVLTCKRSPSSLSQLLSPRSPWARRPGRRHPELLREAYTMAKPPSPSSSPKSPPQMVTRVSADLSQLPTASTGTSNWSTLFARKEFLPQLLPCIRFPMMQKSFLLHVVERNSELMAMPLMKDLLIEAYRFHAFNPSAETRKSSVASELSYAKQESLPKEPVKQYAKIILPLNTSDDLTLSRSQRRKEAQRISVHNVNFSP